MTNVCSFCTLRPDNLEVEWPMIILLQQKCTFVGLPYFGMPSNNISTMVYYWEAYWTSGKLNEGYIIMIYHLTSDFFSWNKHYVDNDEI